MPRPGIAQPPSTFLVSVKDPNLAIDGAGRAAVAIGVECDSLDEILMAVLKIEVERRLLFAWRRGDGGGHGLEAVVLV